MGMILVVLHLIACVVLAGAAIYRLHSRGSGESAHKFIFPFIIAATVSGALVILVDLKSLYQVFYGGVTYQVMYDSAPGHYVDGRLLKLAEFALVMLPGFGIFPLVGNRLWLVAMLALMAASPLVISPLAF